MGDEFLLTTNCAPTDGLFSDIIDTNELSIQGDWIEGFKGELDAYFIVMKHFSQMEPTDILQALASFSARVSEMRGQLMRVDSRKSTAFRTREIDPFLTECDRQFRLYSRIQSIREMEYKLSGGQF